MASGVGFNPASFGGQTGKTGHVQQHRQSEQPVANPTDGFQASGLTEQPNAAPTGGVQQSVTLTVTPEQLSSAAFQQTLATMQNSGIHVTIALAQTPSPNSSAKDDEIRQLRQDLNTAMHHIDQGMGYIAERVTPKPAPPKYGGD